MDDSVTVHQRNLQLLMIEIYKTRNDLNPSFMKQISEEKVLPYNPRWSEKLQLPKAKTAGFGIDTVRFVGGRVWETLPPELKNSSSLKIFKGHIKTHKCDACNCRLCEHFYPNLVFFMQRLYCISISPCYDYIIVTALTYVYFIFCN